MGEICEDCGKEFGNKAGLASHRSFKHDDPAEVEVKCEECGCVEKMPQSRANQNKRDFCSYECRSSNEEWRQEQAKKISEAFSEERRKRMSELFSEREISEEQREQISETLSGEDAPLYGVTGKDHPTWKGGILNKRWGENWSKQRKKALERDNEECRICGSDELVQVHHIIPRRFIVHHPFLSLEEHGNDLENLICLCPSHHRLAEHSSIEVPQDYEVPADIEINT